MSPYKELLMEKITDKNIKVFKDQVKDLLVFNTKVSLYKKAIRSKFSLLMIPILILIGIAIIVTGIILWKNDVDSENSSDTLYYMSFIGAVFIIFGVFYKKYRQNIINSIFKKITRESNWNKIYSKWLDILGIKYDSIKTISSNEIKQFYDILKDDDPIPKKANVIEKEGFFSFKYNNITTHIFLIKWVWSRKIKIKNIGKSDVKYLDRLYVVQSRDDKIYQNFNLKITIGFDNPLNNSHETLENNNFNKKFNYKSNDEIILRKLLTPYTQESLTKKITDSTTSFTFRDNHYVTSCDLKDNSFEIKDVFSIMDVLSIKKQDNSVDQKDEVLKWILINLKKISLILGYSYIIQNFFK